MNIFVSNDDGIDSKGLLVLVDVLMQAGHKVYTVAPKEQQSATSNSMTLHAPLYVQEVTLENGAKAHHVTGTPADCVKLGMEVIHKDVKFDYLISGINIGSNLGVNAIYSGTISAATEGALVGLKAIAISAAEGDVYRFDTAGAFLVEYMKDVEKLDLPKGTLLNVNIPNLSIDEVKGYKYTRQGNTTYTAEYSERVSPRDQVYYWHFSQCLEHDLTKCADYKVMADNYVSITPMNVDRTDYTLLNSLKAQGYDVEDC